MTPAGGGARGREQLESWQAELAAAAEPAVTEGGAQRGALAVAERAVRPVVGVAVVMAAVWPSAWHGGQAARIAAVLLGILACVLEINRRYATGRLGDRDADATRAAQR